jgi:AcrR family transcriptional regulator
VDEPGPGVCAEQGLDVPLEEIARRAGTGSATLYRRFPTREDLIAAVFAERMSEHRDAVRVGLADEDPWRGFASYVTAAAAMQARDRGIADLVITEMPTAPERPDEHGPSGQINTRPATI